MLLRLNQILSFCLRTIVCSIPLVGRILISSRILVLHKQVEDLAWFCRISMGATHRCRVGLRTESMGGLGT